MFFTEDKDKIGLDKINPFFYDYIILGIDEIEGRFNKF